MRLHLRTTANSKPVPFNYHQKLVGAFHKWLGENEIHDNLSLYSLSWLRGGKMRNRALTFPEGAHWFISSPDTQLIKQVIDGLFTDPAIAYGMSVQGMTTEKTPDFGNEHNFKLAGPVLIKRQEEGKDHETHFLYHQDEAGRLMTETLKSKLLKSGLGDKAIEAAFDLTYKRSKTKMVHYKGIGNKANMCPVILKGDPEAISFAWDVGVGNSTGIGFGALM